MSRVPLADPRPEKTKRPGAPPAHSNLHRAIANLPDVADGQRNLIRSITEGLDRRTVELAILAHAALVANAYCWQHHVVLAERAGISNGEISALKAGQIDLFEDDDRTLLAFVQAVSRRTMDDRCWQDASEVASSDTLLRLVMLVGFYSMMTDAWSALAVPVDDDLRG